MSKSDGFGSLSLLASIIQDLVQSFNIHCKFLNPAERGFLLWSPCAKYFYAAMPYMPDGFYVNEYIIV